MSAGERYEIAGGNHAGAADQSSARYCREGQLAVADSDSPASRSAVKPWSSQSQVVNAPDRLSCADDIRKADAED